MPVVSVIVTVPTSTPDWNVVPPDCVIVSTPMLVPTAPVTVAVPVVLIVTFSPAPPAVPVTEPIWIVLAMPVPTESAAPSSSTTGPSVIAPLDAPPMLAHARTVTVVFASPSVITPVVASIVPETVRADGAVATTPPAKVKVSPPVSPICTVPVLRKVVAPAIVFLPLLPPRNVRLYGWAAVTSAVEIDTASLNWIKVAAFVSVTVPTDRAPITVTVSALVIVKPVSGVVPPTVPPRSLIETTPVDPASIVSVPTPSIELVKVTLEPFSTPALVVSTVMLRLLRSTRPANSTKSFALLLDSVNVVVLPAVPPVSVSGRGVPVVPEL